MGIRVHKAIGYGLVDLKTKPRERGETPDLVDSRIDPAGFLLNESAEERFTFDGYLQFLKTFDWRVEAKACKKALRDVPLMEQMILHERNEKRRRRVASSFPYGGVINYDPEFGLPNVLLVIPPSMLRDWFRYDSTLDYCEEVNAHRAEPRVVELLTAPHPWEGNRIDLRTGKLIADPWLFAKGDYAEKPGTDWSFAVPPDVAAVCKYLKLFKREETIRSLKPLLYVWWS